MVMPGHVFFFCSDRQYPWYHQIRAGRLFMLFTTVCFVGQGVVLVRKGDGCGLGGIGQATPNNTELNEVNIFARGLHLSTL